MRLILRRVPVLGCCGVFPGVAGGSVVESVTPQTCEVISFFRIFEEICLLVCIAVARSASHQVVVVLLVSHDLRSLVFVSCSCFVSPRTSQPLQICLKIAGGLKYIPCTTVIKLRNFILFGAHKSIIHPRSVLTSTHRVQHEPATLR